MVMNTLIHPASESAASGLILRKIQRRRIVVIYNPTAGLRRYKRLESVIEILKEYGCSVELRVTSAPGHASLLAQSPMALEADAIAVAGGDGTIAETVNGLVGNDTPLGIIPLGTANVLATEINLSNDLKKAAHALLFGPAQPVYMSTANDHCFVMMAGAGLDAHVVDNIDLSLKRRIGKGAYVIGAIQEVLRNVQHRYTVVIEGEPHTCSSVIIANGRHYGGAFISAPQANISDPLLYACLFKNNGAINVARYGFGIMRGRLAHYPDVKIIPARELSITGQSNEPLQCDGDIATRLPATIRVGKTPFNLIFPF